MLEEKSITILN